MRRLLLLALGLLLPAAASADDAAMDRLDQWPSRRGPSGDGRPPKADPPVEWSETTNVRWKVPIPGSGSATPAVWGGRIYVLPAIDTKTAPPGGAPPLPPGEPGLSAPSPGT